MYSDTPETDSKSKFFNFFLLRKRKKPTQTLISVPWKVPQAFSSTEVAIAVLSSILPVAFHSGFCQFRKKLVFFMQNASEKGLQRLFWWTKPYVAVP